MARPKPPAAPTIALTPEDAEAAFYEAMAGGDVGRMMALWVDDEDALCVHPGGGRIVGTAAVRASYEAILADGGIPVSYDAVHRLQRAEVAVHHLIERVVVDSARGRSELRMLATNVYLKTPLGWRIAVHHVTAAGPDDRPPPEAAPTTLH
ncbi:YybH family protein [Rubrivivax gelatinosus]|uniref:Ketosteroid isomerase-like protein n=1 Tax=Rubrivivax gelatinosus TaxID=28068 RepID=A0A4R2LTP4_RUBGE|nr:nuclear transport factor 2 family protein [Rubrivivax gelatinosus]MBK1689460.1 DUF4440 domain-containing protein [Rubrivivax gelatinosus]TCO97411.1 ketosteroid isomerase-like protein [Rubrivivax gelatinosus]